MTLGEICAKSGGFIQTGPFGSQLHASDYTTLGVPVVMPVNIGENRIAEEGIVRIPPVEAARLERHKLRPGNIVYGRRGDIGRRALITNNEDGWLCGTGCLRIDFGTGGLDPEFATYFLSNRETRDWIVRHAVGTTMPNLNTAILSAIPFVVPPLSEQKDIGRALGALDDKIELNRRMNQTLESMACAIFRSWFVDFDPVVAKAAGRQPFGMSSDVAALFPDKLVSDERGEIPFGWHFRPLAKVTTKIGSGATPRGGSAVYVPQGTAFIRSQNVLDHEFEWNGLARITDEAAQQLRSVTVLEGDVLLNITGESILRTCLVDAAALPARVSQHVAIIRPSPGIPSRYLHLRLVDDEMKEFLIGFDAGGTRQAVTKAQLETVSILVPSATLLTRFDKLTEPLFDRIDSNRRESRTLAALRDALLPKLMSGELRVRDAEKLAGIHV